MKKFVFCLLLGLLGCTRAPETPATPQSTAPTAQAPSTLPASLKGYELYSWNPTPETWAYALLPSTNALKTAEQIETAKIEDINQLKSLFIQVAAGENVFWNPHQPEGLALALPEAEIRGEFRQLANNRGFALIFP